MAATLRLNKYSFLDEHGATNSHPDWRVSTELASACPLAMTLDLAGGSISDDAMCRAHLKGQRGCARACVFEGLMEAAS